MIEFTNKIEIRKDLPSVFSFFSTLENMPMWNYYLLSVKNTTPSVIGEGAEYHQTRKTDEQRYTITSLIENQKLIIETLPNSRTYLKRATTFKGTDTHTLITDTVSINTFFPHFLEQFFKSKPQNGVLENLNKLKILLETGAVQLQDGKSISLT